MASRAVETGRRRRALKGAGGRDVKIQWFIKRYTDDIAFTMKQRITVATILVHSRIVQNISRPVTKSTGPRGGRVVTNRSKPGEFPKAETAQLMKSLFLVVVSPRRGRWEGRIGTPLNYGGILEKWPQIDRNYAGRTLKENIAVVIRILTGPIR